MKKRIFDEYTQIPYKSELYSPLAGKIIFEYTYSYKGKLRIFASKQVSETETYMLEFDEYGRYIIMGTLTDEFASQMLFKSKDEYCEYCRQVYKQNF